ncbi:lactonase family protein [Roseobacter weihaiensis]|uniref:lactonase family protein n=1 Tax=Roseobacter weihaiensis TaxID=2763262 RepID=UPI001D0A0731|nr:lactonase family protein [Roseobacter sp. H9]
MSPVHRFNHSTVLLAFGLLVSPSVLAAQNAPFANTDLVALSDGAMVATGYIDGLLGSRAPDLLSVLSRSADGTWVRSDVDVSNSVATWPNVLAVTADGQIAISTEPFAQPAEDAREFSEIEQGNTLTVIDLSDRANPTVTQTVEAAGPPTAIDIHPSGELIAVTYAASGQIALYPFEDRQLGEPTVQDLGIEDIDNTFVPEIKWHPSGEFAAVTLGGAARIAFLRYADGVLEPWGASISTAPLPGKGEWSADGRHFLVTTINITGDLAQLGYGRTSSLLTVVRFDDNDAPDSVPRRTNDRSPTFESEPVQHAVAAVAPFGMGYVENFAISPDGAYVVGLNMVASWLPKDHPGHTDYSELTVLEIDVETGAIQAIGATRLPNVTLPQGIVFDDEGRHVAVTSYQGPDGGPGQIEFWSFTPDGDDPFARVGDAIPAPRGVHFLTKVAR